MPLAPGRRMVKKYVSLFPECAVNIDYSLGKKGMLNSCNQILAVISGRFYAFSLCTRTK